MGTANKLIAASVALDLIKNHEGILIGSRALGVDTENSDWDVAILAKNFPIINRINLATVDMENYVSALPLRNSSLYRGKGIDILVYDDEEDFHVVKLAINDIEMVPSYLLKNKDARVSMYTKALLHYGFKPSGSWPAQGFDKAHKHGRDRTWHGNTTKNP